LNLHNYSETCLNWTLSKLKTCLNQTDFTVPSTKCLCNLNLCKPNTCLNWTNYPVPKEFGLDRFYCITTIIQAMDMFCNSNFRLQFRLQSVFYVNVVLPCSWQLVILYKPTNNRFQTHHVKQKTITLVFDASPLSTEY
jgi:hypothetical protein